MRICSEEKSTTKAQRHKIRLMRIYKSKENELLLALQQGLPLEPRPFAKFAEMHGISEMEILTLIKGMFRKGTARRLGGIFDSRHLGYRSALCAVSLDKTQEDKVVSKIRSHSGITHCYLRGWPKELRSDTASPDTSKIPNLWFTFTERDEVFDRSLKCFEKALDIGRILVLPSKRKFKVEVIFFSGQENNISRSNLPEEAKINKIKFCPTDKKLIRILEGDIPLVPKPFSRIAMKAGISEKELLEKLRTWKKNGILRRLALIVRHQKIGFKANAMCVWNVPRGRIASAGRKLAGLSHVTHCYERTRTPEFPYNLYAMTYAESWRNLRKTFLELSRKTGLRDGLMLCSLKEFKKTSPKYFN